MKFRKLLIALAAFNPPRSRQSPAASPTAQPSPEQHKHEDHQHDDHKQQSDDHAH
jgi:hypothetical protein